MDHTQEICRVLTQKKALFQQYEEATQALLECEPDSMDYYITKRQELANQIDVQTENIRLLCEGDQQELLENALSNRAEYTALSSPLQEIFMAAQDVLGIASHVQGLNAAVLVRMQQVRDEARVHIAANQNGPKIARYRSGMFNETTMNLLGDRYEKV